MAKTDTNPTAQTSVEFADQAFKTRTVVLADGRSFAVDKARIATDDPALIAHLTAHPEFERVALVATEA